MINTKWILEYLTDLKKNNNREWFASHKEERKAAEQEFEALIGELILEIQTFDKSIPFFEPRELTFKLVRDTRFSNDKSPYNPTFRAHISSKGKLPVPAGYYVCIKPGGGSFLGGGLFADMFSDATAMVRDYIAENPLELSKIVEKDSFKENFTVMGTKLKNVPRGYDKDHRMAEYLKHKSWFLEYPLEDASIEDADHLVKAAGCIYRLMNPFNTYLNCALKDFSMPERG